MWKMEVFCPDVGGMIMIEDLPQDVPAWRLEDRLASGCSTYHQKVHVQRRDIYKEFQFVGYKWIFTFSGLRADVPQFMGFNMDIPEALFYS